MAQFFGILKILMKIIFYRLIFPPNIDDLLVHRRNEAVLRHNQNWVRCWCENLYSLEIRSITYEVCNVSLASYVFNCQLSKESSLAVVKCQFMLRDNINEVWSNIQGGLEQVSVSFEVLISTRVLVAIWFWHISFFSSNFIYYYPFNILIIV